MKYSILIYSLLIFNISCGSKDPIVKVEVENDLRDVYFAKYSPENTKSLVYPLQVKEKEVFHFMYGTLLKGSIPDEATTLEGILTKKDNYLEIKYYKIGYAASADPTFRSIELLEDEAMKKYYKAVPYLNNNLLISDLKICKMPLTVTLEEELKNNLAANYREEEFHNSNDVYFSLNYKNETKNIYIFTQGVKAKTLSKCLDSLLVLPQ